MKIIVSEEIESVCPTFVGACVEARVENTPYSKELWDEINSLGEKFKETLTTESLKEISGIAATRKVYRACGKDPSRYRPASEALIRRMLQGKELFLHLLEMLYFSKASAKVRTIFETAKYFQEKVLKLTVF